MATIIANGCFDLLHDGHRRFLSRARWLLVTQTPRVPNKVIVAVNSDRYARELKAAKWGEKYPLDDLVTRCKKLIEWSDQVVSFDSEEELHGIIEHFMPCIIVKGPDYARKSVTGDDIAPVLILYTPEPESVKRLKIELYGQLPNESCKTGTP